MALAGNVGIYFADISSSGTDGYFLEFPLSLFASVPVSTRVTLHGEAAYIFARVIGTGKVADLQTHGAAAARAMQTQPRRNRRHRYRRHGEPQPGGLGRSQWSA